MSSITDAMVVHLALLESLLLCIFFNCIVTFSVVILKCVLVFLLDAIIIPNVHHAIGDLIRSIGVVFCVAGLFYNISPVLLNGFMCFF